ncbi:MAG: hypothetical protein H6Q64_100 [Firmicutes bacterium]|nr:hypothetical protein [Bacillota bacterium]
MNIPLHLPEEIKIITGKIDRQLRPDEDELLKLIAYAQRLRRKSYDTYRSFYDLYADLLYKEYGHCLTPFRYGRDDFFDYLVQNWDFLENHPDSILAPNDFPAFLHEYLLFNYGQTINSQEIESLQKLLAGSPQIEWGLPVPRQKEVVYKYEKGNSFKELGLKSHFEKIGRYDFVSRVQSYRYLRGNKSSTDKIEVLGPDYLGGIFTNKEKSIYYYIFLTENNYQKAVNACQILNNEFYGR